VTALSKRFAFKIIRGSYVKTFGASGSLSRKGIRVSPDIIQTAVKAHRKFDEEVVAAGIQKGSTPENPPSLRNKVAGS
jgi:hypothetical protein